MSNYLDGIPQAVATIVSASYGAKLSAHDKTPTSLDEDEKRIINFTDQLTRAMTKALREAANSP